VGLSTSSFSNCYSSVGWLPQLHVVTLLVLLVVNIVKDRGRQPEGVNMRLIKFFCKNRYVSQVQTPKPKLYKKVMNTSTNSVEMISS
jgi:hypothetical protein